MHTLRTAIAATIVVQTLVCVGCSGDETPVDDDRDGAADAALDAVVDADSNSGCQCTAKPPLACLCGHVGCPATLAEAMDCSKQFAVSKREGCGYTLVQIGYQNAGYGYGLLAYDSATQKLIGLKTRQETPFGPCTSLTYTSEFFPDECPLGAECGLCGKKGEAGDAGPC
ncbi:MAG: hypothetical protein KJ015_39310 [Myxococcales bacterium]|nr:hypothetical protein [Myxococcales bacterium]